MLKSEEEKDRELYNFVMGLPHPDRNYWEHEGAIVFLQQGRYLLAQDGFTIKGVTLILSMLFYAAREDV